MEAGAPAEGWRGIAGGTRDCVEEDGSRRGRRVLEESSTRASLGEGAGCAAARESRRVFGLEDLGNPRARRKKKCGRLRPGRGRDAGWRRRRWDGIVVDAGQEGRVRPVAERDSHSFETKWLERGMCERALVGAPVSRGVRHRRAPLRIAYSMLRAVTPQTQLREQKHAGNLRLNT